MWLETSGLRVWGLEGGLSHGDNFPCCGANHCPRPGVGGGGSQEALTRPRLSGDQASAPRLVQSPIQGW